MEMMIKGDIQSMIRVVNTLGRRIIQILLEIRLISIILQLIRICKHNFMLIQIGVI